MLESGVGTIAAGVYKAKADLILISGAEVAEQEQVLPVLSNMPDFPVEIGLAETQQTLVMNT